MLTHQARAAMATDGLLTREQARDAGLTSGDIRVSLRTGALVAMRRGVYADGERWRHLDVRGQQRVRTRAALRTLNRGFVISHDSAAYEHGLDILLPPVPHVHITRPGSTTAWSRYNVKHHYAAFAPGQVVIVDGLPVLDLARTAVDVAREHGEPYGEIACDSALRLGASRLDLEEACAPMVSWPYRQRMIRAVQFARPGAETVAETLGRMLVEELGIGPTDLQFPVRRPDGATSWCDIRVGRHVFEVDGFVKLVPRAAGGVADESPQQVLWRQQKRDRALHGKGLGTSHIIWQDFWSPHRQAAVVRLRSEYDDTVSRLGTDLPEQLVREAAELRARRDRRLG